MVIIHGARSEKNYEFDARGKDTNFANHDSVIGYSELDAIRNGR